MVRAKHLHGLCGSVIDLSRRYDAIVVDIGAVDGLAMESILRIADLATVPFQPNEMDVWTADLLNSLVGADLDMQGRTQCPVDR